MNFTLIPVLCSVLLFGAFSLTQSRASTPICGFVDYVIVSSATGSTYSEAYNALAVDLDAMAANWCHKGACEQTITVTSSHYIEEFNEWILFGREDFRCHIF